MSIWTLFRSFSNKFGIDPVLAALAEPPVLQSQAPVLPRTFGAGYSMGNVAERTLPDGVSSIGRWRKTLCELPKVMKDFNGPHAYEDLVAMAEQQSPVRNYLLWCLNYNGTSARAKDLASYLRAVGFATANQTYFPGSSDVRRFK